MTYHGVKDLGLTRDNQDVVLNVLNVDKGPEFEGLLKKGLRYGHGTGREMSSRDVDIGSGDPDSTIHTESCCLGPNHLNVSDHRHGVQEPRYHQNVLGLGSLTLSIDETRGHGT